MKHSTLFIFSTIFLLSFGNIFSQNKYMISFTDKKGVEFNPYTYFDTKVLERRAKNNITLSDSSDFPINRDYINNISNITEQITSESRWLNSIFVYANYDQIEKIKNLPFVKDIEKIESQLILTSINENDDLQNIDYEVLKNQIKRMGSDIFDSLGINGKGIRIAIFDGGFPGVDTHPAFEHIRKEKRIIKTWDFTKNKEFVYDYISHGTSVMSCIGGMIDDKKIGIATGAEFLLARTEVKSEPFSEEENWLAAAEWAYKNGADIINSSLGYTYHRYFNSEMDGKTSLVSKAANMAASKGILVVNAAGNDGTNNWKYIGTPADADSVLTVGGINPDTDFHTSFSSYGPTSDKRMKPNVCAYGHVVAASKNALTNTQGTSFASPLVAGFAACALQINPELNNMDLFKEIEKSGDLYPFYDYAHGFGVPQADHFTTKEKTIKEPTFEFVVENQILKIIVEEDSLENTPNKYLYYHIENKNGVLDKYSVIIVEQKNVLQFPLNEYTNNEKLRVHYKGYTESFDL